MHSMDAPGSTDWFMIRVLTTSAGVPSAAATSPAAREEQACVAASSRKPQSSRSSRCFVWRWGVVVGGNSVSQPGKKIQGQGMKQPRQTGGTERTCLTRSYVVRSPSCTSAARWQLGAQPRQSARTPPSCATDKNACQVFLWRRRRRRVVGLRFGIIRTIFFLVNNNKKNHCAPVQRREARPSPAVLRLHAHFDDVGGRGEELGEGAREHAGDDGLVEGEGAVGLPPQHVLAHVLVDADARPGVDQVAEAGLGCVCNQSINRWDEGW